MGMFFYISEKLFTSVFLIGKSKHYNISRTDNHGGKNDA